jgi:hypothetical protein
MSNIHRQSDGFRNADGQRQGAIAPLAYRLCAAFAMIRRRMIAATMPPVQHAPTFDADGEGGESDLCDPVRYPQAPLILGDKWDF